MGVASWSFDLVWAVGGSGPVGGLLPAESWAAGWCSGVLPVWWVLGWGWFVWCWHRRRARCGGLLGLLWSWWSAVVGAPLCWGWHAVGVLGQCALVAWPAFSASLFVGGVGVGVGGLVVNCIVDASILL